MYRYFRASMTAIAITAVGLAALAGGRAQSADTDLKPAIQEMRDEIRELRRDVKALRELLERTEVDGPAAFKRKPESVRGSDPNDPRPVCYFFYAKWSGPCQQMMPIICRLQTEGHRIIKVDIDKDNELRQRFNVQVVPTLWIETAAPQFSVLSGIQSEGTIRSSLRQNVFRPKALPPQGGATAPSDPFASRATPGHSVVSIPPTDLPAAPSDRKEIQIKNYIESFAGDSGKKMTGSEMIASVDGQPVFASEIFQRAFVTALTPDGVSLATATKALAAGQIEEPYFRQLQLLALRKFSQNYLSTRGWAQAMIASLGKTEIEKTENTITDEFNKYVEKLEKDLHVTTVFDVDKKLREQGTSLLALKAEFRDRLLADEFVKRATKGNANAPAKRPQSQAGPIDLDRRVTIDCDDRPLSDVLDQILRDEPIIDFSYDRVMGTVQYPIVHPIVRYLPAVQNETKAGGHPAGVAEYLDAKWSKRVTLHVKDVPVSVALQRVFDQTPLDYWIENGVLRVDFPADKRLHKALQRKVTFDCDKLPLRKFIRHIENDWQLGEVVISGTVDLEAPITLQVADTTRETVLKLGCQQAHVQWEFENGRLSLWPVEPPMPAPGVHGTSQRKSERKPNP
ncbi:MAG TPA: thioredoxin domain-containing protein [Planctomycetaceae bacterium]|nr:thioredoxin domain-containing protein [Planctomycetaceae bacterium]